MRSCAAALGFALGGSVFAVCQPASHGEEVVGDSPAILSLERLAQASRIVFEGTVISEAGVLPRVVVPNAEPVYADRLVEVRVARVHRQVAGAEVQDGDVVLLSMATTNDDGAAGPELNDLRTQTAAFSHPLPVGATVTAFAVPDRFSDGREGWTAVASDYGILLHRDGERVSQAPLGPLEWRVVSDAALEAALTHMGRLEGTPLVPYSVPTGVPE
jgi:hypothetical protein